MLKVFGATMIIRPLKERRVIVAAQTKKRAVELLVMRGERMSMTEFNRYFAETANKIELDITQGEEGVWTSNPYASSKTASDYISLDIMQFNYLNQEVIMKKENFESYRCLCLSTAHLTKNDVGVLEELAGKKADQMIFERDSGFFIKLYEESEYNQREGMSAGYHKIIEYALAKGFRMIEFDCDVEALDIFESHNW